MKERRIDLSDIDQRVIPNQKFKFKEASDLNHKGIELGQQGYGKLAL